MYNIKLFAEKVMPNLRDVWEGEWEDRWWINPLPSKQRAPLGRSRLVRVPGRAPFLGGEMLQQLQDEAVFELLELGERRERSPRRPSNVAMLRRVGDFWRCSSVHRLSSCEILPIRLTKLSRVAMYRSTGDSGPTIHAPRRRNITCLSTIRVTLK